MPRPAKPAVIAYDFPGIQLAIDPRDFQDGAAEMQINLQSTQYGEMQSRAGIREVSFEDE